MHTTINKTYLIYILGILAALGPFTIDMYLPGFPRIAEDLYTDEQHVTFTLTSYYIGIAFGQLIYGPIVDKYGRKKPLLIGLLIFTLAALGCALSVNIEMMIGMRLLQALGGCVGMVASNAIISDTFEMDERAKAYSSIMLVMGVAPLIAPSLGSFFVETLDWEFIFYFLAAFTAMVIALIYFYLPETSRFMHSDKLRFRKIAKSYLEILRHKTFLLYTLGGSIALSVLFAYIASASYIFLTYYKLDKATFSILFAVNAAGFIAGSYANGIVTKYMNFLSIARIASVVLTVIATVALPLVYFIPELPYPWVGAALFLALSTLGFINPNTVVASLAPFSSNAGTASALGGALRMSVGAVVAAAIGIFQGTTSFTMFMAIFILAVVATLILWFSPKVLQ